GQAGSRERMPPQYVLWDPELSPDVTDLVLDEAPQRLDDLERHDFGQTADVVVRLDPRARLRLARARLDHVGVDRPLHQQAYVAHAARLLLEAADELLADDRPLLLGIAHSFEAAKKALRRIDVHETQTRTERGDDLFGLVRAQQPGIDEHAREPIADRARHERGRDRGIDAARESADRVAVADRAPQFRDGLVDERRGRPVAGAAAHAIEEVAQHLGAARRVHHL